MTPSRTDAHGHETAWLTVTQRVTQGHAAGEVTAPYREQGARDTEADFVLACKAFFLLAIELDPRPGKSLPDFRGR